MNPSNADSDDAAPVRFAILRGTESGIDADFLPRYLAREGEPVDQLNRPLDRGQLLTFQVRPEFIRIHCELGLLMSRVEALAGTKAGMHLCLKKISIDISNAQRAIRYATPFAVCPSCAGIGLFDARTREHCPTCAGSGFIGEGKYESLNADLKRIAEGYRVLE
jgi:hypothetical protein